MSSSSQVMEERLNEYAKEIATLKAENKVLRKSQIVWHRVEDGLPECEDDMLGNKVWTGLGSMSNGITFYIRLENDEWELFHSKVDNIIAWAELPTYTTKGESK